MPESSPNNPAFPATRWSLIVSLNEGSDQDRREALSQICRLYWYPLYAYVRRRGHQKSDAEDLTQGFFCQLLGRESLESIKLEEGGKLRSFLLTGIQHYITSDWRRGHAKKRGGDFAFVPLEWDSAELRYAEEDDSASDSPEHAFDRLWALQTLENALARLKAEYVLAKKEALFEALQPALGLSAEAVCYDALGLRTQPDTRCDQDPSLPSAQTTASPPPRGSPRHTGL